MRRRLVWLQGAGVEPQSITLTFSALFSNAAGKLFVIKGLDIGLFPSMTVGLWPISEMIEIGDMLPVIGSVSPRSQLTSLSKTDFVVAGTYFEGSAGSDSGRTVARFYRKTGSGITITDIPASLFSNLSGIPDWNRTTVSSGIAHNGGWCQFKVEDMPNFGLSTLFCVTFGESGIIAENSSRGEGWIPFFLPTVDGLPFEFYPFQPLRALSNIENTMALRLHSSPFRVYRETASTLTIGEGISPGDISENPTRFFQGDNLYYLDWIGSRYEIKHAKVIGNTLTLQDSVGEVVLPSVPSGYSLLAVYPDTDNR